MPSAFCSIATDHEGVPHKMLTKYQQQQAVLSVPFNNGSYYTMTTRVINAKQEELANVGVKMYLYSTRPMQASPIKPNVFIAHDAQKGLVCRASASQVVYGIEEEPDDMRRQASDEQGEQLQRDPKVLQAVIGELEEQRDSLFEFNRGALKGGGEAAVLERLRQDNQQLVAQKAAMETELRRPARWPPRREPALRRWPRRPRRAGAQEEVVVAVGGRMLRRCSHSSMPPSATSSSISRRWTRPRGSSASTGVRLSS